jgi:hypothetical protein
MPGPAALISLLLEKAVPDGYTLLFVAPQIATNVVFTAKLPYDIVRDFAPISLTSSTATAAHRQSRVSGEVGAGINRVCPQRR